MKIKKGYIISLLLAFLAIGSAFTYSYLPDYLATKMSRQLSKIFGKRSVFAEQKLPDTLSLNHSFFKISQADTITGYAIISRALGCQIGGCETPTPSKQSFEQFYFVTAFDKYKKIKCVRVLEYTSDHGYQIANKGWLKQFETADTFIVDQNIDGISGATISVNSITEGVNKQKQIISGINN